MQASADTGPSYDQTVEFLISKTQVVWSGGVTKQSVRFPEKCHIEIETEYFGNDGILDHRGTLSAKLKEMDPSSVRDPRTGGDRVYVNSFENRKVVRHVDEFPYTYPGNKNQYGEHISTNSDKCSNRLCTREFENSSFWVSTFDPQNNRPRLIKALSHLIALCGGKAELF